MYVRGARKCDWEVLTKLKREYEDLKKEHEKLKEEKQKKEETVTKLQTEKTATEGREKQLRAEKQQQVEEIEELKKKVLALKEENEKLRAEWKNTCKIFKVLEWDWFWAQWYNIQPQYMGTFKIVEEAKKFAEGIHKDLIASQCLTWGNAFIAGYYWDKNGNLGNFYYNPDAATTARMRVKWVEFSTRDSSRRSFPLSLK